MPCRRVLLFLTLPLLAAACSGGDAPAPSPSGGSGGVLAMAGGGMGGMPSGGASTGGVAGNGGGMGGTGNGGSAGSMGGSAGSAPNTAGTGGGGAGGSGGATTVSYRSDVFPIFASKCTFCHHPASAIGVNITDPFDPVNGLVGSQNTWAVAHPEGMTPALNVAPGQPEESFLMDKITNQNLDPLVAGAFMPWNVPRLTTEELADLRQWITDGANNDAIYTERIRPIFGDPTTLGTGTGKCVHCHSSSTNLRPNLEDPFDPINGAVGVASFISPQPQMQRIAPGDPDNSVLVIKVELLQNDDDFGLAMPPQQAPLTPEEAETVRVWIAEGALDN